MTLQTLVSTVNANTSTIADDMHLDSDTIVINQCDHNGYEEYMSDGHHILCYSFAEKGVGLSRNNALLRASADIVLFSDEDIVYEPGYAKVILDAFAMHPGEDMLLFNVDVDKDRATYHTEKEFRIRWYNCGRYPTYSFAIKRERLHKENITFSLLFGGGAKYMNGEDSLFIRDCLRHGFKIMALPITIGKEVKRPSTWFKGYTEQFFFDRGVLYQCLYCHMARPFALRFLLKHRDIMFMNQKNGLSFKQAYAMMKKGMREWK